jgi:hypothetical protein
MTFVDYCCATAIALFGVALVALETTSFYIVVSNGFAAPEACRMSAKVWYYIAASAMFAVAFGVAGTLHMIARFKQTMVVVLMLIGAMVAGNLGVCGFALSLDVKTTCVANTDGEAVTINGSVPLALCFMAAMDIAVAFVLYCSYVNIVSNFRYAHPVFVDV